MPPSYPPFESQPYAPGRRERSSNRQKTAGVILLALGLLFLGSEMGLFRLIRWDLVWPLILVAAGIGMLFRNGGWRR
jgi:hypothetical protein